MLSVVVVVSGIIVIPRFEIRAISVIVIIRGVAIQKVRQLNIGAVVRGGVGGIIDGVEGLVIAVYDLGCSRIAATIVVYSQIGYQYTRAQN